MHLTGTDWLIIAVAFAYALTLDEDRFAFLRRPRPMTTPPAPPASHVRLVARPFDFERDDR